MDINYLSSFLSAVLAISLGAERFITFVKTVFPTLAIEKKNVLGMVDLEKDRSRRVVLQVMAFIASWFAASLMVDGVWTMASLFGHVTITGGRLDMPVPLLGLLASGGSAFWNNVLGFTKAAKDTKQGEVPPTNPNLLPSLAIPRGRDITDVLASPRLPNNVVRDIPRP